MYQPDHMQHSIKDEKILSPMLCRICATEHSDESMNNLLTSTHDGLYFVDMLQDCLQRPIVKVNGFPLGICLDCTSHLIIAYNFHLMCNGSEKKFREMLNDYHLDSDGMEQKVDVIVDERESDVKQSHFIDCSAIDLLDTNCDEIDGGGGTVTVTDKVKSPTEKIKSRMSRYECYICTQKFRRIARLQQHLTNYHGTDGDEKLWQCSECAKSFSNKKNLMKHFYKHTIPSCEYCTETFTTLRALRQHCQRTHAEQVVHHQCDRCPKKFVLGAQLRIHMHNHSTSQRYDCNICSETFPSEIKLKGHIRTVHTTYLCSECGKTFKNNSLLTSHQKVHNSEKPFVCSKCPSRFKWRVALTYHMTIHEQDRKHVCETCGKGFTTRSAMKGHMSESLFHIFCF